MRFVQASLWIALATGQIYVAARSVHAQYDQYDGPPIHYSTAEVDDRVARLADDIEQGARDLPYDEQFGYLSALLEALEVSPESQMLVFSKTSMQAHRISPQRPRAIYFNDDVYVGYCRGGEVLEIIAQSAKQGPTFYTLEQTPQDKPELVRDRGGQCLACHQSHRTQNVPGYLIRSVFPTRSGQPEFGSGTYTSDHTSRLKERWGGWYVTGTHGAMRHMGNVLYDKQAGELDREAGANRSSLSDLFSVQHYLTDHSDIVALMIVEHQTQMHNALTWANFETRRAVHQSQTMNEILDREPSYLSETSERRINSAVDRVLQYLLFCDEFPLASPVEGTSRFAADFEAQGVRDSAGRSLRDLDLNERLMKYPCSYMIYSDAFAGLPDLVRGRILAKLRTILEQEDTSDEYGHLTTTERQAIREILDATLPK